MIPDTAPVGTDLFTPCPDVPQEAHVSSFQQYREMYQQSADKPEEFWGEIAKEFYWKTPHTGSFMDYNFDVTQGKIYIKCMEGATTNMCYNVLDRNVYQKKLGDKIAFYWEGNKPGDSSRITYKELLRQVCKCANMLRAEGIKKGDRVAIYMPMIIELIVAMLACTRIGAVHSIVFAGFSAESLSERILDSSCSLLITADGFYRGDKFINLKEITSEALKQCTERTSPVKRCIVVKHLHTTKESGKASTQSNLPPAKRACLKLKDNHNEGAKNMLHKTQGVKCTIGGYLLYTATTFKYVFDYQPSDVYWCTADIPWNEEVDVWWSAVMKEASEECEPEWCSTEDPLFILYTSGSTGKPKGVKHTIGGYLLYTATTFKYVFDYQPSDVYWCTADVGWITGHSYVTYGPLANGATSVLFEGLLTYPGISRAWEIVDKYLVTKFYTAPTAIRMLMKYGEEPVKRFSRKSLKILGTVGEPINPEAWLWFYNVVGDRKCPIMDTFWQTETGGHMLTPLPCVTPLKPGSATLPFFGVVPAVLSESGEELEGEAEGYLVFKKPWPSIMREVYGSYERFESNYFKKFPGYFVTGDGCKRDKDGYYWITGRIDDMLNISGHLLSTAEVESALMEYFAVAEVAAVSIPHSVKGESLYCFVTLKDGHEFTDALIADLKKQVRKKIGPIAVPDYIQFASQLPKTRSGKIMRRLLKKIARNDRELGNTSTLADESVLEDLFKNRVETI